MKPFKRTRKAALQFAAQSFEQIADAMAASGLTMFKFDGLSVYFGVHDHDQLLDVMPFGYTTDKITPELLRAAAKAAETEAVYVKD